MGRIYDQDGWVLLIGVDHTCNTSLHLAEYRAAYAGRKVVDHHAPLLINRHRKWIRFKDINYSDADFDMLGKDFGKDNEAMVGTGRIGCAKAQLFPQRLCVDYAVKWIERKRKRL